MSCKKFNGYEQCIGDNGMFDNPNFCIINI